MSEFLTWKEEEERRRNSSYVQQCAPQQLRHQNATTIIVTDPASIQARVQELDELKYKAHVKLELVVLLILKHLKI